MDVLDEFDVLGVYDCMCRWLGAWRCKLGFGGCWVLVGDRKRMYICEDQSCVEGMGYVARYLGRYVCVYVYM